ESCQTVASPNVNTVPTRWIGKLSATGLVVSTPRSGPARPSRIASSTISAHAATSIVGIRRRTSQAQVEAVGTDRAAVIATAPVPRVEVAEEVVILDVGAPR